MFEIMDKLARPSVALGAMAGSLRQESGLPAEALAKAGGGGGSRTRVLDTCYLSVYMFSW